MPFMVIYRTSDGSSCYEQADAIDEAALFVERLRNKEGIDQIRIYRMEEISFAFRPYYKVELGLTDRQNTPTPSAASTAVVIEGADAGSDEPDPVDAGTSPIPPPPALEKRRDSVADVRAEVVAPTAPDGDAEGEPAGANGRRGLFGR